MPLILPLDTLDRESLPVAGGKAISLALALAEGLPVPEGFCVTTSAYTTAAEKTPGLHDVAEQLAATPQEPSRLAELAGRAREALQATAVPEEVARAIDDAYLRLGPAVPVSVRSSATAEDLPSASFAGQHDTYLNVVGAEAVVDAVHRCWVSLWSDRAVAYRAARGVDHRSVRMAVVVQRMVAARAAGVMFTSHPLREGRGQAVIEASPGLGEAVVSGAAATDHFVVDQATGEALERVVAHKTAVVVPAPGGGTRQVTPTEAVVAAPCLDDADLRRLAELASRVEKAYGAPQDTEFALDPEGGLWLLQARPITTRATPPAPASQSTGDSDVTPTPGTPEAPGDARWESPIPGAIWVRRQVVEHMPGPLSPLFEEIYLRQGLERSYNEIATMFMGPNFHVEDIVDPPLFGTVNGYAYQRADFRLSPRVILHLLGSSVKAWRWLFRDSMAYWRDQALPAYRATVERWRSQDRSSLSHEDLLRGIRELGWADAAYWFACTLVVGAAKVSDSMLNSFLSVALRGRGLTSGMFLRGFPSKTIEGDARLEELAAHVRADAELRTAVLAAPPGRMPEVLRTHPRGEVVLAGLDGYFQDYGHQIYSLDFAEPTQADDPLPTLLSLHAKIAGEPRDTGALQAGLVRERDALTASLMARLDPVRRQGLRRLLRFARRHAPLREEALFHLGAGWPTLRSLAAELGTRLCSAGVLADREDVYFLETSELEAAIAARRGGDPQPSLADLAGERRMLRERRKHLVPPAAVPPEARLHWGPFDLSSRESQVRPRASGSDEPTGTVGTLRGFAVSPGQVTAPASVVLGPEDFGAMTPGTILVCLTTTPAWTALFSQARGLVTDIGGILAHGSIVAREYGIPAVMGTGNATRRIRPGDTITVNGDLGLVHLDEP